MTQQEGKTKHIEQPMFRRFTEYRSQEQIDWSTFLISQDYMVYILYSYVELRPLRSP